MTVPRPGMDYRGINAGTTVANRRHYWLAQSLAHNLRQQPQAFHAEVSQKMSGLE